MNFDEDTKIWLHSSSVPDVPLCRFAGPTCKGSHPRLWSQHQAEPILDSRRRHPSSNELHMPKERGAMKTRLVRNAPSAQELIRKHLGRRDRAEEIHAPLSTVCLALVDVEKCKGNLHLRSPGLDRRVERRRSEKGGCVPVGGVEAGIGEAEFRGVVDGCLEACGPRKGLVLRLELVLWRSVRT